MQLLEEKMDFMIESSMYSDVSYIIDGASLTMLGRIARMEHPEHPSPTRAGNMIVKLRRSLLKLGRHRQHGVNQMIVLRCGL